MLPNVEAEWAFFQGKGPQKHPDKTCTVQPWARTVNRIAQMPTCPRRKRVVFLGPWCAVPLLFGRKKLLQAVKSQARRWIAMFGVSQKGGVPFGHPKNSRDYKYKENGGNIAPPGSLCPGNMGNLSGARCPSSIIGLPL